MTILRAKRQLAGSFANKSVMWATREARLPAENEKIEDFRVED